MVYNCWWKPDFSRQTEDHRITIQTVNIPSWICRKKAWGVLVGLHSLSTIFCHIRDIIHANYIQNFKTLKGTVRIGQRKKSYFITKMQASTLALSRWKRITSSSSIVGRSSVCSYLKIWKIVWQKKVAVTMGLLLKRTFIWKYWINRIFWREYKR